MKKMNTNLSNAAQLSIILISTIHRCGRSYSRVVGCVVVFALLSLRPCACGVLRHTVVILIENPLRNAHASMTL